MCVEVRKIRSGSLHRVMHEYADRQRDRETGLIRSYTGMNEANDKQDKLMPAVTHIYDTCLQTCAREVFITPGGKV